MGRNTVFLWHPFLSPLSMGCNRGPDYQLAQLLTTKQNNENFSFISFPINEKRDRKKHLFLKTDRTQIKENFQTTPPKICMVINDGDGRG